MHRLLPSLAVGLIVLGAFAPQAAAKSRYAREMSGDCQFDYMRPAAWAPVEMTTTAKCLTAKFPVAGGYPKLASVISCESGWDRFVVGGAGNNYVGLSQQDSGSWAYRVNAYEPKGWRLKSPWWNARSNLTVAVMMAHSSGWGAWTCA